MMTKEVPMKKTVKIAEIVDYANGYLCAAGPSREARHAIINMVEHALHAASAYDGYRYLVSGEVPEGYEPGMRVKRSQDPSAPPEYEFVFDDSRRHYNLRLSLRS
jgi:hypothetical protein